MADLSAISVVTRNYVGTGSSCTPVMLNYAGEYGEYCDTCQAAVTVIRSSDAALKSCLEWSG